MPSGWRIVKAKYATAAFDGEGAKQHGGRWNSPGTALVYMAGSRSLALLEMLAHLGAPTILPSFVLIECQFEERRVIQLQRAVLPKHWRAYPPPPELQMLGDRWVALAGSLILEVPSVLVPEESNFLLNPAHPDFSTVKILDPESFEFDMRLLKTGVSK